MSDSGQRTEQPTQRRLQKAREQGQFLSAKDFVAAIQFTMFAAVVAWTMPGWIVSARTVFAHLLRLAFDKELGSRDLAAMLQLVLSELFVPIGIAGGALALLSLGTQLALSSVGWSFQALTPNLGRLNPGKKLGEIGKQAFPMALHSVLVMAALGSLTYMLVTDLLPATMALSLGTIESGSAEVGSAITGMLWKCSMVLLVFGSIDLFRQKRKLDKQLRMTKQEIRDEAKENEGNPQVKGQIRRLRRDLLRRRMMSDVAKATTVIVNPTHYAVAIRYDAETMASPIVIAKGKNYLAKRIRERAMEHQIPIVENPPLARALYASAEVGQQIPVEFYRAVAEILAYIYRMMHRRS